MILVQMGADLRSVIQELMKYVQGTVISDV